MNIQRSKPRTITISKDSVHFSKYLFNLIIFKFKTTYNHIKNDDDVNDNISNKSNAFYGVLSEDEFILV